jgi:hypothetical protein
MQNATEVARCLALQAEAVCRYYLLNGRRQGRYWLIGDVTGVPGRSLYVRLSGGRAGKWTDAATGEHGDLIDLIALNRGLDFRGALDEARSFLRLPVAPTLPARCEPPKPTGSPEAARRLFASSLPVKGSVADAYLRQRGILLPVDHTALRFHPRCYYRAPSGRQIWPALIAAVTDLDGKITGAHRTWLDPSARGKAPVDRPRRAMGHLAGNGVRFGIARHVLTAAEGIETTLALKVVMPGMPMVAALSAAHLAALILPPTLRRLYVARDDDEAGRLALARLRERAGARGIDVRALEPKAEDFNADLLTLGADRLRAWIAEQLAEDDIRRFLSSQDGLP